MNIPVLSPVSIVIVYNDLPPEPPLWLTSSPQDAILLINSSDVAVGVNVSVGVNVDVLVGVLVGVGVLVDVDVCVLVKVCVGVDVGVKPSVAVGVNVDVDVGVKVCVGVDVGVCVKVSVGVDVGVGVLVGVGVGNSGQFIFSVQNVPSNGVVTTILTIDGVISDLVNEYVIKPDPDTLG